MGDSAGSWGLLAEQDTELADVWDGFARLPEPGVSASLDAFVASKHITIGSLVRLGARMSEDHVLAFAYSGGLKYRDVVSGRKWSYTGSDWREMRIVRASDAVDPEIVIIAAGETEGARLSDAYSTCDVAVMPGGELYFPDTYAAQVRGYARVLVATDNDEAGDKGAAKIAALIPHAERFRAPANDFCASDDPLPPLPAAPAPDPAAAFLVSAGDLLTIEPPEQESYFEDALLPVGGQLILHGWAKSFKSFAAFDLLAALSQGTDWATFASICGPVRVAVAQFEIPWAYYRQRVLAIRESAIHPELFDANFMSVTPLSRPPLVAGDVKQEDYFIASLLDGGVEVCLIDPIRRALGSVNMNATEDIRPLLAFAQRLQDACIAVVMTHHDNKSSARAGGGDPLGMTGAGDFAGDCDSIVSVAVPKGSTLQDPKRNLFFTLRNAPSPSPRGMAMSEQGHLTYSLEPFGDGMADDESGGPSI